MSDRLQTLNQVLTEKLGQSWRIVLLSYLVIAITIAVLLYLLFKKGTIVISSAFATSISFAVLILVATILMVSVSAAYVSYRKNQINIDNYGIETLDSYRRSIATMKLVNVIVLIVLGVVFAFGIIFLGIKSSKKHDCDDGANNNHNNKPKPALNPGSRRRISPRG